MKAFIPFCMTMLMAFNTIANDPASGLHFHSDVAKDGDGAFTILKRYALPVLDCNLEKFYALNQLEKDEGLIKGKQYYLPIAVFKYNGVSIRSTISINDWDKAVRIQKYNERAHQLGLRNGDYRNDAVLWVPYHELQCNKGSSTGLTSRSAPEKDVTGTAPAGDVIRKTVPLFGKGYENIKIRSDRLSHKVYYLVSGHGGPDPGAMANCSGKTLCEDEYAYDVTLRLARNLMEQGALVYVIVQDADDGIRDTPYLDCDRDETVMGSDRIPLNQLQRLSQRTRKINILHSNHLSEGLTDQTVICIHVDSRSPNRRQDVFFYYHEKSKSGKKLANNLQKTFAEKYKIFRPKGNYHGTVSSRGLYMLRNTNPTAVYIELANIRNSLDRKRILPESNRQALANWITDGLMKDL